MWSSTIRDKGARLIPSYLRDLAVFSEIIYYYYYYYYY